MFVCTFEEYTGFGETLGNAWKNLLVEVEGWDNREIQPEDCRFFKEISVEIIPREFDIQEAE